MMLIFLSICWHLIDNNITLVSQLCRWNRWETYVIITGFRFYLVIWFRSIPLWICVGGKGKNEKLIMCLCTNVQTNYNITVRIIHVQLFTNNIYFFHIQIEMLRKRKIEMFICILPVPSSGESAPTFSTSTGFDILISVTGRHTDKQQSASWFLNLCLQNTEAERINNIYKAGDQDLDDERGKTLAKGVSVR